MISIRSMIHSYAMTLERAWEHDRSQTIGSSEIGQCARQTWFVKHDAPRDPDYRDDMGARTRGKIMEDHFIVPAIRANLPEGIQLLYAGSEQHTIIDGYLSATPDGLFVGTPRNSLAHLGIPDIGSDCLNVDFKSVDPRINLSKEKHEHAFQCQVQMGLIQSEGRYSPNYTILPYVNASFWCDVSEFPVKFDSRIYQTAQIRAHNIMTARSPLELPPEGRLSGGGECKYCAWASHCHDVTIAGVPDRHQPLDDDAIDDLKALRDSERQLFAAKIEAAADHAAMAERIKQFLREHNTRGYRGGDFSVTYSVVNGRQTLDIAAIEAAGIDLSPYYKTGNQSERLTVR